MSGNASAQAETGLRKIVPAGVAVAAAATGQTMRPLTPSEGTTTTGMAPRRLLEFTAGRTCAHRALTLLGVDSSGVPVGPQREPLWPSGIVGSISHSGELAVAVVAPATLFRAIGVDIEPAVPLEPELIRRICRPTERARLGSRPDAAIRAKRIFSAKESVYKCLWPSTGQFLEFSDVEIVFDSSDRDFTVVGWGPLRELSCAGLSGRITVAAGHIITIAYIEGTRSGAATIES